MITLQPIAMTIPNRAGVYCPSKVQEIRHLDENEFVGFYGIEGKFSLSGDINHWEYTTFYGRGPDCWYILVEDKRASRTHFRGGSSRRFLPIY